MLLNLIQNYGWGRITWRDRPRPYICEPWGFDNGAFPAWRNETAWDADLYLRRLLKAQMAAEEVWHPYLAVVPDIVCAGLRSLEFSMEWIERLPRYCDMKGGDRWPWFLAVQDGIDPDQVAPVAHRFAGIFLGGSNANKARAAEWAAFAHDRGMLMHYGRASSVDALEYARRAGCDSADSSFFLWDRRRIEGVAHWWIYGPRQLSLIE